MHIQIVTFELHGIDEAGYQAQAEAVAPAFAALPGLRAKVWLADPGTNTYGGVYTWDDRAAMETYLAGELFRGLQATPGIGTVVSRDFAVLEEPTKLTRGGH
ncbi:YdhR family protein [Streptomyces vastus]|uniref:Monooxygenase n=1 Tax=Streptomyces vastus TaxID=285451 RepID=A0ABN3R147_9ACTN